MIDKKHSLLFALILVLSPFVWSQSQNESVTLKGTVSETTLLSNDDLHVWVQNGRSGSEVCLGAAQFLRDQGFMPDIGDTIQVVGTRVGNGGLLRANSLQVGGKTLALPTDSARQNSPDCCGHRCGHHNCGSYHHGCNDDHHGHCCDHE